MRELKKFELEFGGKKLVLETGELAGQASGAVKAQYGETVVLATVVMSESKKEGMSYFPLSVDFDEKFYAAGMIKGSRWIKREGRPTDEAVLTGRLIDRTIRPLFNKRLRRDVQVVVTNLSFDGENDPDIPALAAVSAALTISNIPWNGPIGAVRVSEDESGLIVNPTYKERKSSSLDIVLSGPSGFINMIEASSNEVSEEIIIKAIKTAQKEIDEIISFQERIRKEIGEEKVVDEMPQADEELKSEMENILKKDRLKKVLDEDPTLKKVKDLKGEVIETLIEKFSDKEGVRGEADILFEDKLSDVIHENVLEEKKRPDRRELDQVRLLSSRVGVLPRTHGTGLFERGATQALSILTLGAPGLEQSLETMEFIGKKRFMHHYNFPPFSTGETGKMFTGRREIGHGALAEKAVSPVIPSREDFPYTIRIVTEILSSNGSTSMASVCGSSLALMDAGVPISSAVAGIAMGLMAKDPKSPEKEYSILTDIQGPEDHHGDMDLKVAGTENGITALQMDVKVFGVTIKILEDALEQAKKARLEILAVMNKTISESRKNLSDHAPRVMTIKIDPKKIGEIIGPGGKIINQITEETGASIDIDDDGQIFITSENGEAGSAEKALEWVEKITHEVEPGEVYEGRVVKILDFGAFVEFLPGKQGLIHVSELAPWHVNKVEDIVKVGDKVKVRVKKIDNEGRIDLTMKEFHSKKKTDKS